MSKNPLAFPRPGFDTPAGYEDGMTLRDWFAGQALVGMASIALDDGDMLMGWADMAKASYSAADAMLAEREKSA